MTENEKKKEYFNNYKKLCNKLKSLEDQLQSLRETEESAKIPSISDMPKAHKQTDLSDIMVKIEAVYTKIVRLRAECIKRKLEIEDRIADMQDGVEADILRKRYLEFKPWEQICIEIGYSWMQTHRLHSKALSNFNLNKKL
ncbi:uncharacterized protein DUF1492 [Herbinix hemicellulosilytica]|uniref:Uncharacterized protein n=1 Tax=Herbinix hemicellulosilytica TaxID=1564487 RepID=A0A0H5SGL9_HERHM|nr:DUF1492 domain-containing protein [Herbinix hemicellulosilytica]RBP60909.1 uncharacterized protein DUF1492 [Herbinix hemicellulosilytica]CRZ34604.1 hypothetical protein HHT355_1403 [Herbinix hemicellulosilytica]